MNAAVDIKGRQLLADGRVSVVELNASRGTVDVEGTDATYRVTLVPGRGWRCPCPARGRCAHLTAVALLLPTPAEVAS